ncbi:MAG: glycosyltransferase family 4 protein, partial [Patescibacteria group bacterium]
MKVGFVSFHSFFMEGGVKTHILSLEKEYTKKGIDCRIIAPRRNSKEQYKENITLLGTSFPITFLGTQADLCVSFDPFSISNYLEKEKFDVLHFHNMGIPITWQFLKKSKALNILTFHASLDGSALIKNFPQIITPYKKVARGFDGIIGVSSVAMKHFADSPKPHEIIPNGIDLNRFNPSKPKVDKFLDG